MVYEMNKTKIVVCIEIRNRDSIQVTEVVKQALIFEPKMCCATTAKVKNVVGKVDYKYGEMEIAMSIYMDDTSVTGRPEEAKEGHVKKRNWERK